MALHLQSLREKVQHLGLKPQDSISPLSISLSAHGSIGNVQNDRMSSQLT